MFEVLVEAGQPLCDDCVATPSGMKRRQQANERGRELEDMGLVRRGQGTCSSCRKYKTVSVPTGVELPASPEPDHDEKPWHWEGNVQGTLITYLEAAGWTLISSANTASKETGVDVKAVDPDGAEWWITVKGFPERKPGKTTNPSTQARHWFSHAMFDVAMYRTSRPDVMIGVAIPGPFQTYEGLTIKSSWLKESAPFTLFTIDEHGHVDAE
jgi:hypothetical protein